MNKFHFDNPYGYKLNVNHPEILPLFNRYKRWKGVPINEPISDSERLAFEALVIKSMGGKYNADGNGVSVPKVP